jgi:hypothetical protein
MHDEYSRMLEYYKEWSSATRAFIRFFGTSPSLDSDDALQKHEAAIKRFIEATAASFKKALEQHIKVKRFVIDLFVDTVATAVHFSDEESAASYAIARQYGFRKDAWRHYHRYAERLLSIADDATNYLLKKYQREADKEANAKTYLAAIWLFAHLAQQYGLKAGGQEEFFNSLPDAVFVLLSHRDSTWQGAGMHKLRKGFKDISTAATQRPNLALAPRDDWENGMDTFLGRSVFGVVNKIGVDLDKKEHLEPLMEIVAYWNEKTNDLADAHNQLVNALKTT